MNFSFGKELTKHALTNIWLKLVHTGSWEDVKNQFTDILYENKRRPKKLTNMKFLQYIKHQVTLQLMNWKKIEFVNLIHVYAYALISGKHVHF